MVWLDRPSVGTDRQPWSPVMPVHVGFVDVVAPLAQGLERPGQEAVPVTLVRLDLVDHVGWHGEPLAQAHTAQRLLLQVHPADASPALKLIPLAPRAFPRNRTRSHATSYPEQRHSEHRWCAISGKELGALEPDRSSAQASTRGPQLRLSPTRLSGGALQKRLVAGVRRLSPKPQRLTSCVFQNYVGLRILAFICRFTHILRL